MDHAGDDQTTTVRPVSVAAVNDVDIVVHGLAEVLRHDDRLVVRDRILIGEPVPAPVQVALLDTFARPGPIGEAISLLLEDPMVERVAVFTMDLPSDVAEAAIASGATGVLSKAMTRGELADAVLRIAAGQIVTETGRRSPIDPELDWPGRSQGLSLRESEVLVLASEGLTNAEVGTALYIGSETVKTHLRSAFSKLGVRNRVEAAALVHRSGWQRHLS